MGPSLSVDASQLAQQAVRQQRFTLNELTERHAAVEATSCAHEVHVGLAVVVLVGLVDVGLGNNEQHGASGIPLPLDLVGLEKGLLAGRSGVGRGAGEGEEVEHLDGAWGALLLGHKEASGGVATGRQTELRAALDLELECNACSPVGGLEGVKLRVDHATGVDFISGELQRPATLCLLGEAGNFLSGLCAPNAQVLVLLVVLELDCMSSSGKEGKVDGCERRPVTIGEALSNTPGRSHVDRKEPFVENESSTTCASRVCSTAPLLASTIWTLQNGSSFC